MYDQLNKKLLTEIQQHIPQNRGVVSFLTDMLSLGKEAIYRRIRGEVPFTFEEVVKISKKLEISLDQLLSKADDDRSKIKWATFDIDMLYSSDNYMEKHCEKLKVFTSIFREMQNSKKAILREATCFMPYSFLIPFDKLSKFRHYKWLYLAQGVKPDFLFSDSVAPANILELEKELVTEIRKVPRTVLILDQNVFSFLLNDIRYFSQRKLLSTKEIMELKEELLLLVSFMEKLTAKGYYENGAEINLFLSEIDLGSTYTHFEYDNRELCLHWSYFVDVIQLTNPRISNKQKEWIDLLKRFSVQITQTGEMQRFEFFKRQRKLINELL